MVTRPRSRAEFPSCPTRRACCWLLLTLAIPAVAIGDEARTSPRRHVPAKNLVAYCEFDGLDAHLGAWKKTSAYAALNKTKAGAMIRDLANQVGEWLIDENVPFVTGADARALYDHIMKSGFIIAVHNHGYEAMSEMYILRDFYGHDLDETRKHARRLINFAGCPEPTRVKGRTVFTFHGDDPPAAQDAGMDPISPLRRRKSAHKNQAKKGNAPWMTAWVDGNDLIVVCGPSEDAGDVADPDAGKTLAEIQSAFIASILDAADGKVPDVTTSPCFKTTVSGPNDLKGFEAVGRFFVGPDHREDALMAFFDIAQAFDVLATDPPLPAPAPEPGQASPFGPPLGDPEIRRASAEAETELESLPPAIPDEDLEFLRPDRGAVKPHTESKPPANCPPDDDDTEMFSPVEMEALGLNNLKTFSGRFGFQGEAFLTDLRLEAPAPRKGIASFFDQPTFRRDKLPTMPPDVANFVVGSLDFEQTYKALQAMSSGPDPSAGGDLRQFEQIVHDVLNVRLREDLFEHIGPAWCVYLAPAGPGNADRPNKSDLAAYVLLAQIKDAAAFAKVLDGIVSFVNLTDGSSNPNQTAPLEKLSAPDVGYRLTSRGATLFELGEEARPTIMIGKSHFAVAATPDLARAALVSESQPDRHWQPTGKLVAAFEGLPRDLTFLLVSDHRDSHIPDWIASLPAWSQSLINLCQEEDLEHPSPWCLLDPLGLPRPGGPRVRIDPSHVPAADDLRPFLFPSVVAATIDEQGFRLINRGAFPGALVANEALIKFSLARGWTTTQGFELRENVKLRFFDSDQAPKANPGASKPDSTKK